MPPLTPPTTPRRPLRCALALLALAALAAAPAHAERLRVGGTGSSAPLVIALFDEFRRQHPDAELLQIEGSDDYVCREAVIEPTPAAMI